MNKYDKALLNIDKGYKFKCDFDNIMELVERATPMKLEVSSSEVRDYHFCPNCKRSIIGTLKHCPNCGQALDWS
jgi:predicted RNA-binding Zn-ribbon protein involved in translation (DUF1610 family)